jgi:hypothetical protein
MKIVLSCLVFLLVITLPTSASAHLAGQPPFFKMDGVYSNLYPVPTSSVPDLPLPQDLAPANYLIGQTIQMELDTTQLPAPPEVINQTTFTWNFGDGTTGTGLKNIHSYQKMGSYIVSINAQYVSDAQSQLLQSVLLNVIPNKDFKLPKAIIKVNGAQINDSINDIPKANLAKTIYLDGSLSVAPNGSITSYFWDFGDGHKADGPHVTYSYNQGQLQAFPVLRIKDSNGFIADSFAQIENDSTIAEASPPQTPTATSSSFPWIPVIGVGVAIIGFLLFRLRTR